MFLLLKLVTLELKLIWEHAKLYTHLLISKYYGNNLQGNVILGKKKCYQRWYNIISDAREKTVHLEQDWYLQVL